MLSLGDDASSRSRLSGSSVTSPGMTRCLRASGRESGEWDLTGADAAPDSSRMDLYHTWFDLKPGVSDVEFAASLERYLGKLRADGRIVGHRLSRKKLGFGRRTSASSTS